MSWIWVHSVLLLILYSYYGTSIRNVFCNNLRFNIESIVSYYKLLLYKIFEYIKGMLFF